MSSQQSVRAPRSRLLLAAISLFLVVGLSRVGSDAAQQSSPLPPTVTPEEFRTYEAFRSWIGSQPKDVQDADDEVVHQRYGGHLRQQGESEQDISTTIASLKSIGDRFHRSISARILTAPQPRFNTSPNAFLVAVTRA
jgi:hypothetical protein